LTKGEVLESLPFCFCLEITIVAIHDVNGNNVTALQAPDGLLGGRLAFTSEYFSFSNADADVVDGTGFFIVHFCQIKSFKDFLHGILTFP
jgi:hypothetical protein